MKSDDAYKWVVTPIAVSVHMKKDNPIFGESAVHICVEDEAGGGLLILKSNQEDDLKDGLRIDLDQLEVVCREGRKLISGMKEYEPKTTKEE